MHYIAWDKFNSIINDSRINKKIKDINGSNILSARLTNISCRDINFDGIFEIPVEEQLADSKIITSENKSSAVQSVIKWMQISKNGFLIISTQLVYNNNDFAVVNVTDIPSDEVPKNLKASKNVISKNPSNVLEKHVTANPFWSLIGALVFSLIFLDSRILKRR